MTDTSKTPALMPWYVHLIGGWSLSGIFCWYLTVIQFFHRGRKKAALLLAFLNLLLFATLSYSGLTSSLSWDRLLLLSMIVNLFWSLGAWGVQYYAFGQAPRRYQLNEWKKWISPLIAAVLLGAGISVFAALIPLIGERVEMYQAQDILTKKIILWDFFRYIPFSFFFSIPIGLWWAGERDRFSAAHIVTYVFGLIVFLFLLTSISGLFFFLLGQGNLAQNGHYWSVIPGNIQGLKKFLLSVSELDHSTYYIAPLLLGSIPRIRDFCRRALFIFPVLCIGLLFCFGYSHHYWQFIQQQTLYQMSSDDFGKRARAFNTAQLLLDRFPEHQGWLEIALQTARYRYLNDEFDKASDLYEKILERSKDKPYRYRFSSIAEAVLQNEEYGKVSENIDIALPSLQYESYMTNNWMAFIRLLRFYESGELREAETLIKLKLISKKENEIKLSPMPTLAELDDNATNLGYRMILLPSEISLIKKILHNGFPILQPIKKNFYLLNGLDKGRSLVTSVSYSRIVDLIGRIEKEELAEASIFLGSENSIPQNKQSRIDILAQREIPYSYWRHPRQKDHAPYMAVIFPEERETELLTTLERDENTVRRNSKAYLSALIAFNTFKSGDPVQAVTWAKKSYSLKQLSFSLHVAHLGALLWQSRHNQVEHSLELDRHFPKLAEVDAFFSTPEQELFLRDARKKFHQDLAQGQLSWMIREHYKDLLDRSEPQERRLLIELAELEVQFEPESRRKWLFLAGLYEWEKDMTAMISSYRGALDAGLWDDEIALKLAYLHVQQQQVQEVKAIMNKIAPAKVKLNPDYYYCKAFLAQSDNDVKKAADYYEKAIQMRRYDPLYHTDYAQLLRKTGKSSEKIDRLTQWAKRLGGLQD